MMNKIMTLALATVMCLSLLAACKDASAPAELIEREQQSQPAEVIESEAQTEPEADMTTAGSEDTEPETEETEPETENSEAATEPENEYEDDDEEFEEAFQQVPPPAIGGNFTAVG